ncbi:MAG: hypothetical protein D6702_01550 [Planctomycetota bacterium]|nr:MAG: hypothetical protein D6702_01550 [Planctomycetota bacterium]
MLLGAACSPTEEPAAPTSPPPPLPELGGEQGLPAATVGGLRPPLPDGVPRIEYELPSGARIVLAEIAAAPALPVDRPGFHLRLGADEEPRLAAVDWGEGPPPPVLAAPPAAGEEDFRAGWLALGRVEAGRAAVLWLDEGITLGQAEPVFEVLVRRGVQVLLWGFAGPADGN